MLSFRRESRYRNWGSESSTNSIASAWCNGYPSSGCYAADSGTAPIGKQPHMLLMSATPIPRSLAMVLYGDMEVSFLDEMPPGRLPIQTKVYYEQGRRSVYQLVIKELRAGRQAFIVYPLVEASEELAQVRDATQMAEKMRQGVFKEFGVGLVHGKMSTAERDDVMRSFRDGAIGVLVATTVIEVGIDIPNATVMVIEHAGALRPLTVASASGPSGARKCGRILFADQSRAAQSAGGEETPCHGATARRFQDR